MPIVREAKVFIRKHKEGGKTYRYGAISIDSEALKKAKGRTVVVSIRRKR